MTTNMMSNTTSVPNENTNVKAIALQRLPQILHILAAALLLVSIAFPYWGLVLEAPQYPGGLQLRVFVNLMTGDEDPTLDEVHEIDGLNHYIGMKSLYEAAKLERAVAIPAVIIMSILALVAAFWRRRWAWLLAIPAISFPFVFLGDLAFWMNHYGQNLDPYAPLSSAIEPFTPPIIGVGVVGQFRSVAAVDLGWYMAVGGGLLLVIAIVMRALGRRSQSETTHA